MLKSIIGDFMVGQIKKLNNTLYVVSNPCGTLVKVCMKPGAWRVFKWHIRNFFHRFTSVNETLEFLYEGKDFSFNKKKRKANKKWRYFI